MSEIRVRIRTALAALRGRPIISGMTVSGGMVTITRPAVVTNCTMLPGRPGEGVTITL